MKNNKTDIMLLQILLVLLGAYYISYVVLMLREFVSLFSPVSPVPALAMAFLTFWTALGCILARMRADRPERNQQLLLLILCPLLPLSAITGIIFSMIGSIPSGSHNLITGLLYAMCAPLVFGFISGAIVTLSSSIMPKGRQLTDFVALGIGALCGGFAITLYVHQIVNPQIYMAFWGVPLLLWAGVALVFSMPQPGIRAFYPIIAGVMAFIACIAAANTRSIRRYYWDVAEPEWAFVHNVETPRERIPVFFPSEAPLNVAPEVLFYRYGRDLWKTPRDGKTALDSVIPALLQTPESKPAILVIAPPFSGLYSRLMELSKKGRIDIMLPSGEMLEIAMMLRQPVRVNGAYGDIFLHEPFRFMQKRSKKRLSGYDLIFMIDPFHDPLYTSDAFFEAVRSVLKPEGAFICSGLTPAETARMKKVFPQILTLSRDENLLAAGADNITTDHAELEKRFDKISGSQQLPRGIFSILFPQAAAGMKVETPETPLAELLQKKSEDRLFPDWFLHSRSKDAALIKVLKQIKPGLIILPVIAIIYLLYRFIAGRKHNHLLQFEAFENGIFCGGFMLIMMLLYQLDSGSIYREGGLLLGLLGGGIAAGIYLGGISITARRLMQIIGILLPILIILVWNDIDSRSQWIFSATALLTGIAVGAAALDIDSRRTLLKSHALNGFLLLGFSTGICLITLLLFSGVSSYWSICLVVAVLLPRSIDRQLAG
jgi:MFS family permease